MMNFIFALFKVVTLDNKQNGSLQPSNKVGNTIILSTNDWLIFLVILFVILSIVLFFCILSLKEKITELKNKNETLEKEISELSTKSVLDNCSKDDNIKTEIITSIETILEKHKSSKDS